MDIPSRGGLSESPRLRVRLSLRTPENLRAFGRNVENALFFRDSRSFFPNALSVDFILQLAALPGRQEGHDLFPHLAIDPVELLVAYFGEPLKLGFLFGSNANGLVLFGITSAKATRRRKSI